MGGVSSGFGLASKFECLGKCRGGAFHATLTWVSTRMGCSARGHTRSARAASNPFPCRPALPVGLPFRRDGTCFEVDCCHHTKCTECPVVGHHVSTLVLSPDRFQINNKTGNVTRRRTAPPLSSSDFVCPLVTDAVVAEWVRAHHAACWADWRQSQEAAAAAADIVANIHQSGMRTVAAADLMAGPASLPRRTTRKTGQFLRRWRLRWKIPTRRPSGRRWLPLLRPRRQGRGAGWGVGFDGGGVLRAAAGAGAPLLVTLMAAVALLVVVAQWGPLIPGRPSGPLAGA